VTQLSPIVEFLEAAEEGFLTASEKRVKESEIRKPLGGAGGWRWSARHRLTAGFAKCCASLTWQFHLPLARRGLHVCVVSGPSPLNCGSAES